MRVRRRSGGVHIRDRADEPEPFRPVARVRITGTRDEYHRNGRRNQRHLPHTRPGRIRAEYQMRTAIGIATDILAEAR